MANFQKSAIDRTSRFDEGVGRLIMMLDEAAHIDLWGGGPAGGELVVDVNDATVAAVTAVDSKPGNLKTYSLRAIKTGNVMLEARVFPNCPTPAAQRRDWFTKPVFAYIQISVMGHGYKQAGGPWGQLKYGSTNQNWKNVKWTTMAYAGCGPTSLAIVMDYVMQLLAVSGPAGVTPLQTMDYTSQHGRVAGASKGSSEIAPQGTSGDIMIKNISTYWPGYAGEEVKSVDMAVRWLRMGTPLIFLATGSATTWKYEKNGSKTVKTWAGGHYMVLLGVEHGPEDAHQQFWISDPSTADTKYTSRGVLEGCRMWRVYAQ